MEAARALPAWPSSAVPRARGSSIRRGIWLRATQKVPRRRRPSAGSRSSSAAPRRSRARSAWPSTAPLRTSRSGTSSAGATRSTRTSSSPRGRRGASPWFALPCSGVAKQVEQLEQVTIRFAGDSGDGMQLTGGRFTSETALVGNDLSTLPDFPAEIRAPAGSLPGVSGFQLHFADHDILTPGDAPDVLVAMNPAALQTNLRDLPKGGTLIVNRDAFNERNLKKAGYDANPLDDGSLEDYQVHAVPLTSMTVGALKEIEGVTPREAERSKNMFALGLMSWLYGRPPASSTNSLQKKFAMRPEIAAANLKAFNTGYAFGETSEAFAVQYEVKPAKLEPGVYRQITGNTALSYGLIAAS